jgi:hypothetical protein
MEDPTVNPTQQSQESQQSQPSQPLHQSQETQETQENTYNYNTNCRFCNVILYGGMDDNDLMHCQNCHRIWDGNAQCLCDFNF